MDERCLKPHPPSPLQHPNLRIDWIRRFLFLHSTIMPTSCSDQSGVRSWESLQGLNFFSFFFFSPLFSDTFCVNAFQETLTVCSIIPTFKQLSHCTSFFATLNDCCFAKDFFDVLNSNWKSKLNWPSLLVVVTSCKSSCLILQTRVSLLSF